MCSTDISPILDMPFALKACASLSLRLFIAFFAPVELFRCFPSSRCIDAILHYKSDTRKETGARSTEDPLEMARMLAGVLGRVDISVYTLTEHSRTVSCMQ